MRTVETIVRTLEEWQEFDSKVYQRILEKLQDNMEFDSTYRLSEFHGELESVGFTDTEIWYDISYSQGEGTCFTGKWTMPKEPPKYGEEAIKLYLSIAQILYDCKADNEDISFDLYKNTHHYCHEYTVSIGDTVIYQNDNREIYDIQENILIACRYYMRYMFSVLKKDYEYQMSEECIYETFQEYEFYDDGRIA